MRLTLDIDSESRSRLEGTLGLMALLFKGKTVWFRRSASKKGYHVLVSGIEEANYRLSFNELLSLRRVLGDDHVRIAYDAHRFKLGLPTQVLFDYKPYRGHAGPWIGVRREA